MCLIVFSYKQHPRYDLVFAGNRDEFYERPARAARFWEDHPDILAGKDLKAGGTWMGVNRSGEFAAITNYRVPEIKKENPPSRGFLVLNYLNSEEDPKDFLSLVDQKADQYNGFSLLAGYPEEMYFYSNQTKTTKNIGPGLYGLSNHLLDTPWPKVKRAKQELKEIMEDNREIPEEALFELLKNDIRASEEELPDTGIPKELERAVSPIFIQTEKYGTRCSTLLLIDKNKTVTFVEKRYKPGTNEELETNRYKFNIEQ